MALDSLQSWKESFADQVIPTQDPISGATVLGNWVGSQVNNKLQLSGITGPGMIFTFNVATFVTQLLGLVPTPIAEIGATAFANAWLTAINTSVAQTQVGTIIGVPGPTTTFSQVNSTIIDPSSQTQGYNKLVELKDAEPASDPLDAPLPIYLREAFLLLTITTSGLDSTPSPAGPLPLVDPSRGVE